ncbi:MAG: Gfo/Idh/MocA family protein [Armatimonadota bacterium]
MLKVGIIGYGGRIQGMIDLMQRYDNKIEITAITDLRNDEIKEQMKAAGKDPDKVSFYTDADEMLDNNEFDGVMVGTRCSLHTKMGIKVLDRNIPLFLEKPVATNMEDLIALRDAGERTSTQAVVSFPLRVTPLVKLAKEIIDSGKIGTVEHVQAWNNVPYGAVYYQYWYRDENETQGLFLQKATHDFDYINSILGTEPQIISAMTAKRVYKGDRPAGKKCDECDEFESCLESPYHEMFTKQIVGRMRPNGLMCGFAVDTGNEDSGSALIQYESGMHVCYSQNFFARRGAAKRGATLFGYKGTVEFDWYTDELKVIMHHSPRVETIKCDPGVVTHGGGDLLLIDSFVRIMKGEDHKSVAPLDAGLLSVLMCLKAKESAATKTFQEIRYPDR